MKKMTENEMLEILKQYMADYEPHDRYERHFGDIDEVVQCDVFNFCGCGMPDENIQLIYDGLKHIQRLTERVHDENDSNYDYNKWFKDGVEIFGNERSCYFFFYWTETQNLTEHSGSVPGWLTPKGMDIVKVLDNYYAQ